MDSIHIYREIKKEETEVSTKWEMINHIAIDGYSKIRTVRSLDKEIEIYSRFYEKKKGIFLFSNSWIKLEYLGVISYGSVRDIYLINKKFILLVYLLQKNNLDLLVLNKEYTSVEFDKVLKNINIIKNLITDSYLVIK